MNRRRSADILARSGSRPPGQLRNGPAHYVGWTLLRTGMFAFRRRFMVAVCEAVLIGRTARLACRAAPKGLDRRAAPSYLVYGRDARQASAKPHVDTISQD